MNIRKSSKTRCGNSASAKITSHRNELLLLSSWHWKTKTGYFV
nr:MAG TPA: hypothetical protein [Caudoviricetes sp.]